MATRKLSSNPNFVHNDEIWKDHVRHEIHSLRQWPKKWGYLRKEYNNLNKQLVGEPITPESARGSPIRRRAPSASVSSRKSTPRLTPGDQLPEIATSSSTAVTTQEERPKSARKLSAQIRRRRTSDSCQLPAISRRSSYAESKTTATPPPKPEPSVHFMGAVAPRPPKYPYTTAGEVGWKSTLRENHLEIYGRYAPNARGQHGILKLLKWPQQGL